jgi:hypothetical protein
MISLRRGAFLTNPVVRGAGSGSVGFIYSDAGRLQIQGAQLFMVSTNGGVTLLTSSLLTNQAITLRTFGAGSGIYLWPDDGGALGFRTNSTVGYVWTATNDVGYGDWKAASGGGGSLTTNANQFGASTTLTIKSGVVLTNLQGLGDIKFDNLTFRNVDAGNPSSPALTMTNGSTWFRLYQDYDAESHLDFSNNLMLNGSGKVIIQSGLQLGTGATNGFVLTSDSLGNATWAAPSTNGLSSSTNFITLASGSATIGNLIVTNAGSFGSLTNTGTLTANSLGSNAVVSLIGKTASGQLVETSTGFNPSFIRGLLVTRSASNIIAVSSGTWYHNVSNRVYSLPASTLSVSGLVASTMYSVYASVSNSLPVLEAFSENPPATNYFGTARQRASGTIGRWIGHFITDSVLSIAATRTREDAANSVSFMYQTSGTIANRILSAGPQTALTVLTADAICPKYAATEMWSCFQFTYATTALAPLVVGTSLDGTNVIANFGGYVSVANNFVAASGWHPLSTNNTIYYKNTITSPGVAPSTYVDVYGGKYSR